MTGELYPDLAVYSHHFSSPFVSQVNNLSLSHGHLFQSTKCSSFHVTPVATNESVSAKLNGSNNDQNKKLSNVYRNGRGPCDLGESVCGETGASYKLGGSLDWSIA